MYDQIKNLPQQSISKAREYVCPTPSKLMPDNMESKDLDCKNNLKSLEIFLKRLKLSQNPSLNKLKVIYQFNSPTLNIILYTYIFFIFMQKTDSTTEIKKNAIEFLYSIGKEEQFGITYLLISNKTSKRSVKVIVIIFYSMLFIFFS